MLAEELRATVKERLDRSAALPTRLTSASSGRMDSARTSKVSVKATNRYELIATLDEWTRS